ncbi:MULTISPECIES: hypothetical protein [unclassified Pseudofrankia]|uniref:hypothetical protein n=1 Tax=unclassified Pseudofrankia TaxID=2994372 RepID=UPI0008D9E633|nr:MULTISPECIES: hypothetical protein [unclassified Pseudofrankia]MDT3438740.1 hypothetical protein [Pseudofrankia sp. BMG5.37]OHV56383.1 hypothetical protein BCD48_07790 [Pseudofrankia sp. BMG5.36]
MGGFHAVEVKASGGLSVAGVHRDPPGELTQLRDSGQQSISEVLVVGGVVEYGGRGGEFTGDQLVKVLAGVVSGGSDLRRPSVAKPLVAAMRCVSGEGAWLSRDAGHPV